ncbi:DNA repair protein RadC [Paracrocinitomix mangrovi]|uniref:RadC family protein n=1 Tax=Paracrocinitomix mangrovi TaxID=2862509 RepID=UPI001C8EF3A7|nr:DNA repair protein RadC [Paracrocinitomix mangrovi]UKN01814.1 DNA repair protein RadC [Paracrocinitomix mangrovi]
MSNYLSIKKLAADDRPREKLRDKGATSLSNAEIIAILIGSGNADESAVQLSQRLLSDVGNDLNKLARLSVKDLMKYKGIGEAKAITIAAALEMGRRRKPEQFDAEKSIKGAKDVYETVKHLFQDKEHEEFYAVLLSRANKIKSIEMISMGGVSGTVADGKIIYKKALENTASGIILCHNHPSGNLNPSQSDITLTKKLIEFGKFIDIMVLDHLIVTDAGYYSFADEGLM